MKILKLIGIMMIAAVLSNCGTKKPEPSVFEVPQANERMQSLYAEILKKWPVPYREIIIQTGFGETHVLAFGNPEGKPLILMHGTLATSMMWLPNAFALAKDYQVFAVDYIGDLGLSTLKDINRFPKDGDEVSSWLSEVMRGLNLDKACFAAHSYGGWATMEFGIRNPEKIEKLALIAPVGLTGFTLDTIIRLISLYSEYPRKPERVEEFISFSIGTLQNVNELCSGFLTIGLTYGNKAAMPQEIGTKKLAKIQCPVLLILGNRDAFFGRGQSAENKVKDLKNFHTTILDSGHMISIEKAEDVNVLLTGFL